MYFLKDSVMEEGYSEYFYYDRKSDMLDFSGWWSGDLFNKNKDINGNYTTLKYTNCYSRDNIISSIVDCLCENFPTTSFLFSVIENKNNKYHFHLIIGIKNFIDYNFVLKINLHNYLLLYLQNNFFELD
jgi:hypothetical protein